MNMKLATFFLYTTLGLCQARTNGVASLKQDGKNSLDVIAGFRWNRSTNLTNHRATCHLNTSVEVLTQA